MRAALLCEKYCCRSRAFSSNASTNWNATSTSIWSLTPLEINRIMNRRLRAVQLTHIRHDAVRLRISHLFSLARPLILKESSAGFRYAVSCRRALEPGSALNRVFSKSPDPQEIDLRSGLSCLSNHRQKTIDQFNRRDAALIRIVMDLSIFIYIDLQMR